MNADPTNDVEHEAKPASDGGAAAASRCRRTVIFVATLIIAFAALLVAGWPLLNPPAQSLKGLTTPDIIGSVGGGATMLYENTQDMHPYIPLGELEKLPTPAVALSSQLGGEPMAEEPADLSPYPDALREAGVRRQSAGEIEEIAFWLCKQAGADEVAAHYTAQATRAGYTFLPRPATTRAATPSPTSLVFYRDDPATAGVDRVLTIRLAPQDPGTRVTLWLRYPMPIE